MTDPRKLQPSALVRLLNSTPLGEVIKASRVRADRQRAGNRIGDDRHVDLLRYMAWLIIRRHAPRVEQPKVAVELHEAADGAAVLGSSREQMKGHGQKLTSKQEAVIAALLTEPSYGAAARKAGVGETTLYRWLQLPEFRQAYRQARRELVENAIGRVQAATGQAVEALLHITRQGKRDGDRIRAATAILDHARHGLADAELFHGRPGPDAANRPMGTSDVVQLVSEQLRQLVGAELTTAEQTRLTATLADALLRAIGVDVIDKRLAALQTVLDSRKEVK